MSGERLQTVETDARGWIEALLATGDNRYWGKLFETYKKHVFNACRAMLGNDEDASDLTVDTFMKALGKIRSYDPNRPFLPWLLRVAKNLCIDHIRRSRRMRMEHPADWERIPAESDCGPEETDPVRIGRIRSAILGMKRPQKVCFCLFYLHDRSYKDIAAITGFSDDQVRSHIQNGRRKFRLRME